MLNAQQAGLAKGTSRRHWPVELLRKVTMELAASVPSTLLADQLWIGSASHADWWLRQQRFSRSLAFMSMVNGIIAELVVYELVCSYPRWLHVRPGILASV